MAIKDRLKPASASVEQSGFTCPHYDPPPDDKRCRHFIANGSCALPDVFMCVEWLKANGHSVPAERGYAFSHKAGPAIEPSLVHTMDNQQIRSIESLGVEICIASEAIGDVWLVPEYTGTDRREITIEHAATLTAICAAFPGAKVVQFEKAEPKRRVEPET